MDDNQGHVQHPIPVAKHRFVISRTYLSHVQKTARWTIQWCYARLRFMMVGFLAPICRIYDPISSLSHLIAAGFVLIAAFPLVRLGKRNRTHTLALTVYAICVFGLLSVSGIYHCLHNGAARSFMRRADYLAIWFLIAGTFTAIHGVMCRGFWRRWVLLFVWTYAGVAIVSQAIWFHQLSGLRGLLMYLMLGWLGLVTVIKIGRQIGFRAVRPLWLAGIVFSVGALSEAAKQPRLIDGWLGPHEVFHFAVIAGVTMHWLFIRRLVSAHQVAPPPFVTEGAMAIASSALPQPQPS